MSESSHDPKFMESFDPELRRAFEFANQKVDPTLVDYSKVKMGKSTIKLSGDGTFYTLQGEGPTLGVPCVFVRLHVCNLKCTWCDAWYTWNPNTPEFWTEGRDVDFASVAKQIEDTWGLLEDGTKVDPPGHKRVIWTGGEPLIQRKQIDEVMKILNRNCYSWTNAWQEEPGVGWNAEFETNGTLMPTEDQLYYAQFNCSPKLGNSENLHHSMVKPKILAALNEVTTTFKFVVMDNSDLDEIEEKYLPHIDHDKVIIMPQGITEEEVSAGAKRIVEECKARGYTLMPRAQSIYWDGARRGV